MVLGDVIAVEARAVIGLGDGQPVGIELAERHPRVVDVVEDAEFHTALVSKTPMAGTSPAMTKSVRSAVRHSGIREIESLFDTLYATVQSIETIGQVCILTFHYSKTPLHLTHVVAQPIDRASYVTQMLQHNVVGVGHGYFHSILVIS